MADNTPNTPAQGTGALSLTEALDILSQPAPPPPRRTRPADPEVSEVAPPEDDDDPSLNAGPDAEVDTADDPDAAPEPDPEVDAPEEDTATTQEPSYKVVVDGKESAVPVTELVKGYQRHAVFTQRSQALADERRAFETEQAAIREERSQYAALLVKLQGMIEGGGEQEPDWGTLEKTDPMEYAYQSARWGQKRAKMAAIDAEQRRLMSEAQKEAEKRIKDFALDQHRLLLDKVPEYRDPKVRQQDRDAIRQFGVDAYGFTSEELDQLVDHRAIMVLRDARSYRQLQAKRGVVEKRVVETQAPLSRNRGPVVPSTSASAIKAASERLSRTGRLQDAVALHMARSRVRRSNGDGSGN